MAYFWQVPVGRLSNPALVEQPLSEGDLVVASDPFRDWRAAHTARGDRMMYYKDQYIYLGPFPSKPRAEKSKKRAQAILSRLAKTGMLQGSYGLQVIQHRKKGSVRPTGWYVEVEQF